MRVILASGSPRRKELLKLIVPKFEINVSGIDETLAPNLEPYEQVERLAYLKAKDIFEKTSGDRVIIGSDTVVAKNKKIYGKPKDEEDAKRMIKELLAGDRTHEVITGLAILIEKDGQYQEYKTFDSVKIYLKDITDQEIDKWIATGKAFDKAGAYAIQEEFGIFVEKIEGNHNTVVGLPIHQVYDILKLYLES